MNRVIKRFSLNWTLTSSDSYSLDVSFHYMFGRYIGVGGALGYWANYYENRGLIGGR